MLQTNCHPGLYLDWSNKDMKIRLEINPNEKYGSGWVEMMIDDSVMRFAHDPKYIFLNNVEMMAKEIWHKMNKDDH